MEEPSNSALPHESGPPRRPPTGDHLAASRRGLLRRLLALLAAGGMAFGLTTWTLVRFENPLAPMGVGSDPAGVVKAQLEALNRGELRAAYQLFSERYREKVSFEAYRVLVVTHRRMFRTREFHFSRDDQPGGRAVLDTHIVAESGKRYVARFTLVRAEGRWWIDDLHWTAERSDTSNLVSV